MDIISATTMFILAFLGLILVVFLIFILWLAHEYNITFSIRSKKEYQDHDEECSWSDQKAWGRSLREDDSVS